MADPKVRGVGAYGSGTSSFTAAVPTGGNAPQAGDLMLIFCESSASTTSGGSPNTPDGWTSIFAQTGGAGVITVSTHTIFAKIAGASESDVALSRAGYNHMSGAMLVLYDHGVSDVSTDIVIGSGTEATANSISWASISVTANSLIVLAASNTRDATDYPQFNTPTNSNLGTITEHIDQTQSGGVGGGVMFATGLCSGTSTGSSSGTLTGTRADRTITVHLGIPPGAGNITLDAPQAAATAAAFVPDIMVPPANATADAFVPSQVGQGGISAPMAEAVADVFATNVSYELKPPQAAALADGTAPTLAHEFNAPQAAALADGIAPSLAYQLNIPQAAALADALVAGYGTGHVAPQATALADGLTPGLAGAVTVEPPQATATSDAFVPGYGTGHAAPQATATADGLVPGLAKSFLAPQATASADAFEPSLTAPYTAEPPTAEARADALAWYLPDGDVSDGSWVASAGGGDLWAMLDEFPAADADYISAAADTTCELSLPTLVEGGGLRVSYRASDPSGTGGLVVTLVQGTTVIATWTDALNAWFEEFEHLLTSAQAASITDPSDLRIKFEAVVP